MSEELQWSPESMLEVTIKQPDDFLKVRETLTRIGVASRKDKTLFQSCHILHNAIVTGKHTLWRPLFLHSSFSPTFI